MAGRLADLGQRVGQDLGVTDQPKDSKPVNSLPPPWWVTEIVDRMTALTDIIKSDLEAMRVERAEMRVERRMMISLAESAQGIAVKVFNEVTRLREDLVRRVEDIEAARRREDHESRIAALEAWRRSLDDTPG